MDKRPNNPTFGLYLWGPLVPAADCRPCLYTLTGIQAVVGLTVWWYPTYRSKNWSQHTLGRRWGGRLYRAAGILGGTYLLLLSGLELIRLQLPNDPWAQDVAEARVRSQEITGKPASTWFGPASYRPIDFQEWRRRINRTLATGEVLHERIQAAQYVYEDIRQNNREMARQILENLRRGTEYAVSENILERDRERARLMTPEDHEHLVQEWDELDPWDRLDEETSLVVRLVPHARAAAVATKRLAEDEDEAEGEVPVEISALDTN